MCGIGNVTRLQCSCLENPRDGGAWWATVYGVTQSRTRLKRLSSSSIKPKIKTQGFPLAIQWLRLHSSNTGVTDLIPGQGTKIPHAMQFSPPKKEFKIKTQYYMCLDIWGKLEGFD